MSMNIEEATKAVIRNAVGGKVDYLNGPVPVNEASLTHILGHAQRGFCILSACRSDWVNTVKAEMGSEFDKQSDDAKHVIENANHWNRVKTDELKKDLVSMNMGYIPVYGGYKETVTDEDGERQVDVFEESFVVPCHPRDGKELDFATLEAKCIELGTKYNQDTILSCPPNGTPHYVATSTREGNEIGDTTISFKKDASLNDLARDYFTSLNKVKANPSKFSEANPRRFSYNSIGESIRFGNDFTQLNTGHGRHCRGEICRYYRG